MKPEQLLCEGSLTLLKSSYIIAVLYQSQGKYAEAEPLLQRALHIYEQVLEANHINILISLAQLGILYENIGELERAKAFYQRILSIHKLVPKLKHPSIEAALEASNALLPDRLAGDAM